MAEEQSDGYESTNIHIKWLENIYEQLKNIQSMERLAKEGCSSLVEYFQIPYPMQRIMIPDIQYKNIRFIVLEMQILISNLTPILKEKTELYNIRLKAIADVIDRRELFLKEIKANNQVMLLEVLPFMNKTISMLSLLKSFIIKDIGHILYLAEDNDVGKKKW